MKIGLLKGQVLLLGYSIKLSSISISDFKSIIMEKELLPSPKFIIENIVENTSKLESYGIKELQTLKTLLNNSIKLSSLSANTGIPSDYLTILKRELHALEQTPVSLTDFGLLDTPTEKTLRSCGIRSSRDF